MSARCAALALLGLLLCTCVGGHIPPSTFQFTNVVPYTGTGQGGWKVAQVVVLLSRISPLFPETATCDIEVGVPEVNLRGPVSDAFAQAVAASAADAAARKVLGEHQPTSMACAQFRQYMERIMGDSETGAIPGTRVTNIRTMGVPKITFP